MGLRVRKAPKGDIKLDRILTSIVGFVLAIYGFLAFILPDKYPILGLPPAYTSPLGGLLLVVGLYLLYLGRKKKED